eukprot:3618771-Heterocapsa_arctica.AAC.1
MEYSSHSAGNSWGIELLRIMYLRMNSHQRHGTFTGMRTVGSHQRDLQDDLRCGVVEHSVTMS